MLRRIVKALPTPAQRAVFSAYSRYNLKRDFFDLEKERPFRQFVGEHIAVVGYLSSGTGVARAAELLSLTLESRGSKVTRVDISTAIGRPASGMASPEDCYQLDISDVVFFANPGQPSLRFFDRSWLIKRTIIAHWIWEIERAPSFWQNATPSYDEIWAGTDFLIECFRQSFPNFNRPMRVVPYAIDKGKFPAPTLAMRHEARLAENLPKFVAGYSFAVGSNYNRKNPEDAIAAFQRAFPSNDDCCLILRSKDGADYRRQISKLRRAIGRDDRIRLYVGENLSIQKLYACLDVYLSTSRSEGYGLNLVEAAQSGLPVITCGWRIPPEILALPGVQTVGYSLEPVKDPQGHYTGVSNAVWARPNIDDIAASLRSIYETHAK